MRYRVLYEKATDEWVDLDLIESPVINYQVNNLAELKDRQVTYSQALKIPRTRNNCAALGYADVFSVPSDAPFKARRCQVLCDGLDIFGGIARMYVNSVEGEYFSCQIVSSVADVFSAIEAISMEDHDFNMWWDLSQLNTDGIQQTDGGIDYRYLFTLLDIEPYLHTNPFTIRDATGNIDMRYILPSLPVIPTIRKLFEKVGFSLVTDIEDGNYTALADYFSCANPQATAVYLEEFEAGSIGRAVVGATVGYSPKPFTLDNPSDDPYGMTEIATYNTRPALKITAPAGIDVTPNLHLWGSVGRDPSYQSLAYRPGSWDGVQCMVYLDIVRANGSESHTQRRVDLTSSSNVWEGALQKQHLSEGDVMYLSGEIIQGYQETGDQWQTTVSVHTMSSAYIRDGEETKPGFRYLVEPSKGIPAPGDRFNLLYATGAKTPLELVKLFLQLYGLTIEVDHASKTVYAYTMNRLYRRVNDGDYVDWSSKMNISKDSKISFRIPGYAQTNIIEFKANDKDNVTDRGVFKISDDSLELSKTLFTLAAEAGVNITDTPQGTTDTITVASIPVYEVSKAGTAITREFKGTVMHVIQLSAATIDLIAEQTGLTSKNVNLPIAVHKNMQGYLNDYYTMLVSSMLVNARKTEVEFDLTAYDIFTLDLLRPVFLEYFGAYFYISKINNFSVGKLTKAELIRL